MEDLAFGGAGVARHERLRRLLPRRGARRPRAGAGAQGAPALRRGRPGGGAAAGPGRVAAPCPYVPRCGGCRLQHVDYAAQLAAKREQVARAPGADRPPRGHRGARARPRGRAVRLPQQDGVLGGARRRAAGCALGFHARGRWDEVIDVRACLLATPLGNAVRETVRDVGEARRLVPYDQRAQAGVLRHVVRARGRRDRAGAGDGGHRAGRPRTPSTAWRRRSPAAHPRSSAWCTR